MQVILIEILTSVIDKTHTFELNCKQCFRHKYAFNFDIKNYVNNIRFSGSFIRDEPLRVILIELFQAFWLVSGSLMGRFSYFRISILLEQTPTFISSNPHLLLFERCLMLSGNTSCKLLKLHPTCGKLVRHAKTKYLPR